MINLLPPEIKEAYRYAWLNQRLLKWCASFMVAIAGVAVITGSGAMMINKSSDTYKMRADQAKFQLTSQNIMGTQKQIAEISGNLKLMVQVLSKEVLFSKLLVRLGNATPSDVVLTNLSISQTESAIDITAQALNYDAATQLQANLADTSNQIFSKADIVNINCQNSATQSAGSTYPCTVTIRALFTANNPFLFISDTNAQKASS